MLVGCTLYIHKVDNAHCIKPCRSAFLNRISVRFYETECILLNKFRSEKKWRRKSTFFFYCPLSGLRWGGSVNPPPPSHRSGSTTKKWCVIPYGALFQYDIFRASVRSPEDNKTSSGAEPAAALDPELRYRFFCNFLIPLDGNCWVTCFGLPDNLL